MSLLLLFGPPTTYMCWGVVATYSPNWTVYNGLLNTWDDWSAYTWNQIQSANLTWDQLSNHGFTTVTTATTTWTVEPGGSCPIL
jgi:hypothetical protein